MLIAWPDFKFPDSRQTGARTSGDQSRYGIFRYKYYGSSLTEEQLFAQHALERRTRTGPRRAPPNVEQRLWQRTLEEQKRGFLSCFHSAAELDVMFPVGWASMPLFGVRQGDKLRPIDDSSVGRNSVYSQLN
jgi:hypothetical protein